MNEDIDTLWKYLQPCGLVTPSSAWGYTESFNRKSTLIASLHVANQVSSLRDEKGMALLPRGHVCKGESDEPETSRSVSEAACACLLEV